jgi:hypothetical protein
LDSVALPLALVARLLQVPLEASLLVVSLARHHLVSLVVEDPLVDLVSSISIKVSAVYTYTDFLLFLAGFAPPPGFAPQGAPRKSSLRPP